MLKRNIFINYLSQLYMAGLNILVVPIYLKLLGAEAYGLIGVFVMAQGLMQILDIGLSAMLSREATKFAVSPETAPMFRYVFDKVSKFFITLSLVLIVVGIPLANLFALDWFNYKTLNPDEVLLAANLIVIIVAIRFLITPLRNVLLGLEKHVWLNVVVILMGSLKYLGIIPIMVYYSKAAGVFFKYELCIAILEAFVISVYTLRLLPKKDPAKAQLIARTESSSKLIKFSLGHGFVAMIWIVLTQVDRLVLSKTLPLDQFGFYSAVVTASGGIMLLSSPLSRALLPRMTALIETEDIGALVQLYRSSTRFISLIVVPIGILIMGFSAELLLVWTGNIELAVYGQNILYWYALGNTVVAISAFPYYLQYAYGELRLHVISNIISLIIGVPLIAILAINYGAVGAAIGWAILQISSLMIGPYFMHRRFLTGMHWHWLIFDVMPGFLVPGALVFILTRLNFVNLEMARLEIFIRVGTISMLVFLFCFALQKVIAKRTSI